MNMFIVLALVCSVAAVHCSYLPYGGIDSYAVPNYAYNYAIKDIYGGAQDKYESRIGDLTKEHQNVVVHHHEPHGHLSGVSEQHTEIVRHGAGHGYPDAQEHGFGEYGYAGALGYGGLEGFGGLY